MPTCPSPALDELRPAERAAVLDELLRRDPDLRADAERAAIDHLRDVTAEAVARHVAARLLDLGLEDLATRAGRVPGGYVHETDAACELVFEAIAPFEEDLQRCISLDLTDEAARTLHGLLMGFRTVEEPADGTVLAYAGPDVLRDHADWLVSEARRSDIEIEVDVDRLEDARRPSPQRRPRRSTR